MKKLSLITLISALLVPASNATIDNTVVEQFQKEYDTALIEAKQNDFEEYLKAEMAARFNIDDTVIMIHFKELDGIVTLNRFGLWHNYLNIDELYAKANEFLITSWQSKPRLIKTIANSNEIAIQFNENNSVKNIPLDSPLAKRIIEFLLAEKGRY